MSRRPRRRFWRNWPSRCSDSGSVCDCVYGKVARSAVRYGERERPGARSEDLLIEPRVAHAPRTVPLAVPYTYLQTAIVLRSPRSNSMAQTNDCIFCKILSGEVEVSMVYQDDCCSA